MHPATLLPSALLATLLAADLSAVKPRKVAQDAAMSVTAANGDVAVVTHDGELWAGSGTLRKLGSLPGTAAGLHLSGDVLTAWSTVRTGLCVETELRRVSTDGSAFPDQRLPGAPLAILPVKGAQALLWPDRLDILPNQPGAARSIPLPASPAVGLSLHNGRLQVDAADGPLMAVDLATGCPVGLEDDPQRSPLERWRVREARRLCETPPHLPDPVRAEAEIERAARLSRAMMDGDTETLARLGPPTCAGIEAQRPTASGHASAFTTRREKAIQVARDLDPGRGFMTILREPDPAMDLGPWVSGPFAPACEGRLILAPEDAAVGRWLRRALAEADRLGASCADNVRVADPGDIGPEPAGDDPSKVLYVKSGGSLLGVRQGAVSARMARLDIARLAADDPLHDLAQAPELTPSWSVSPGPGGPLLIDVDGSWVAGAGWDLVRGPPNAIRKERTPLLGPVSRLQGRSDGRFEVVAGGQPARVALEDHSIEWMEALSPDEQLLPIPDALPPRPETNRGPWRIVGEGRVGARSDQGERVVDLGLPISRLINGRLMSVLVTPVGLVGIDGAGKLAWRLTEVDRWVWTEDFVVGSSPWGVQGYRLPF